MTLLKCQKCGKTISGAYISTKWGPLHKSCFQCAECGKAIEGQFVDQSGEPYHHACYRSRYGECCSHCGKVIDGEYFKIKDKIYCKKDYINHIVPKCTICDKHLLDGYIYNDWDQKICKNHKNIKTCFGCGRYITNNILYDVLSFKNYCKICSSSSINRFDANKYGSDFGNRCLGRINLLCDFQNIKIVLVEKIDKKQMDIYKNIQQLGITKTMTSLINGRETNRQIEKIEIQRGMPYYLFESTLAHEYGHAFLYINNLDNKPSWMIEGFCQLLAYRCLESISTAEAKVAMKNIMEMQDQIYGDGFRAIYDIWTRYGTETLLEKYK